MIIWASLSPEKAEGNGVWVIYKGLYLRGLPARPGDLRRKSWGMFHLSWWVIRGLSESISPVSENGAVQTFLRDESVSMWNLLKSTEAPVRDNWYLGVVSVLTLVFNKRSRTSRRYIPRNVLQRNWSMQLWSQLGKSRKAVRKGGLELSRAGAWSCCPPGGISSSPGDFHLCS